MHTVHIRLFASSPHSPQLLATARLIEQQQRSDHSRAIVHIHPLEALMVAPAEFERHAYATGSDPAVQKGGRSC